MAKAAEFKIRFLASDSPDVSTNRMYWVEAPTPVDYTSAWVDVGNVKDADGFVNVDLGATLGVHQLDGVFNIGVAAVDDLGNEADMSKANDLPLDFVAPNPVGSIEIL
jgi:hypothetical protein